ncbi:hypothetical protein NX059_006909 [Plenodomus lindquistii]|nr:hypothetical protein NX059_006909 [Plenodomus lindquistii]
MANNAQADHPNSASLSHGYYCGVSVCRGHFPPFPGLLESCVDSRPEMSPYYKLTASAEEISAYEGAAWITSLNQQQSARMSSQDQLHMHSGIEHISGQHFVQDEASDESGQHILSHIAHDSHDHTDQQHCHSNHSHTGSSWGRDQTDFPEDSGRVDVASGSTADVRHSGAIFEATNFEAPMQPDWSTDGMDVDQAANDEILFAEFVKYDSPNGETNTFSPSVSLSRDVRTDSMGDEPWSTFQRNMPQRTNTVIGANGSSGSYDIAPNPQSYAQWSLQGNVNCLPTPDGHAQLMQEYPSDEFTSGPSCENREHLPFHDGNLAPPAANEYESRKLSFSISTSTSQSFFCSVCTANYSGRHGQGNLRRHVRNKHASGGRNYPCGTAGCEKTFKRSDARLKHTRKNHAN